MPDLVRFPSPTRALLFAAWCFGATAPMAAQHAPASASRSESALVVVLSAQGATQSDAVRSSRITNALGGREVVSIYTTDTPVAYKFAAGVHTAFGGSLIPYDRRAQTADDFASLLVHNAVDHAARQHPGQAILVVVEPDLMIPFLRRATGKPTAGADRDDAGADGFTITMPSNGDRTAARLPF